MSLFLRSSSFMAMNPKGISLVDIDDDITEVVIENNRPWSDKNESIYVKLMDDDVQNYNSRAAGSFTKEAWQRIRKKLIKLTGYPYTENQVKNKFNQLRITHKKFVSLCMQSGVGWCPIKGTVDATEEILKRLYKINSKAKASRKGGFPHYLPMTRVLGDSTAKGINAFASTQALSRTDSSDPEFKIKDEDDIEDLEVDNLQAGVKERGKVIKPKAISKKRKRDSYSANLGASLNVLSESSRTKVQLLEIREKARAASITDGSLALFKQCSSILNGMDDLDGSSYSKALTKLKEDPSWRSIFLKMPDKRKMDWCMSLL
ncbi:uncharacterized protein LOC130769809 isoform X2 [Actinidia eriantha]|uniref:uncharacterized protein LOC130769809 isoform X2 n=1 Tax=Actinidia eriantha TaxID=165200 RepID=UPI00258DB5CF|nr:uncharacterized protein LOC130769809 isoform X2 [Actinidia eriantha]